MPSPPFYPTQPMGFGGIQRYSRPTAGGAAQASQVISGPGGGVIGNTVAETNCYRHIALGSLAIAFMVLRFKVQGRYSCTGTPLLTFRMRTGSATPLAQDLAASVVILCRNGANQEPIDVELNSLFDTAQWLTEGGHATIQGVTPNVNGTAFCANQFNTGLTVLNFNIVQITAQWSAADPLNSLSALAASLEILYPVAALQ